MADILVLSEHSKADVLALLLEFAGHRCSAAYRLREAVTILRNDPPDLVLVDCCLYKTDSQYAVNLFKGIWPNVPVLMITADRKATVGADEVFILRKPLDDLFACVEYVLQQSTATPSDIPNSTCLFS